MTNNLGSAPPTPSPSTSTSQMTPNSAGGGTCPGSASNSPNLLLGGSGNNNESSDKFNCVAQHQHQSSHIPQIPPPVGHRRQRFEIFSLFCNLY